MNLIWRVSPGDADSFTEILARLRERGVDAELDAGVGAFDPETAISLVSGLVQLATAIAALLPELRRGAEVDASSGEIRQAEDLAPGVLRVIQGGRTIVYEGVTAADVERVLATLPPV